VTLTFKYKINGFPGLVVEHFYVTFGDYSFIGLGDIVRENSQIDRQTPVKTLSRE